MDHIVEKASGLVWAAETSICKRFELGDKSQRLAQRPLTCLVGVLRHVQRMKCIVYLGGFRPVFERLIGSHVCTSSNHLPDWR